MTVEWKDEHQITPDIRMAQSDEFIALAHKDWMMIYTEYGHFALYDFNKPGPFSEQIVVDIPSKHGRKIITRLLEMIGNKTEDQQEN